MSQFKESPAENIYFNMDIKLFTSGEWAKWPSALKTVFPVICAHANSKSGKAFPSEERIALLSGITPKTVRKGIQGLSRRKFNEVPILRIVKEFNIRGVRANEYYPCLWKPKKKETFTFLQATIFGGNWRTLNPNGQALYPVMRACSYFDLKYYCAMTGRPYHSCDDRQKKEIFKNRMFDLCQANEDFLRIKAGISRRRVGEALISLESCGLIEPVTQAELWAWPENERPEDKDLPKWKVYIRPLFYAGALNLDDQNSPVQEEVTADVLCQ